MIDAVGMEAAHGHGALHAFDRAKQATRSESDRRHALRDEILACRPGGIVSVIGVYGGLMDKFPSGAFMNPFKIPQFVRPHSVPLRGTRFERGRGCEARRMNA